MLKTRVIPTLLWRQLTLVKGSQFNNWRSIGSVLPSIKVYNLRDVDELILVDITATHSGREPDYEAIAEFTAECRVPLTVGGGIRSVDQIRKLLKVGADKVSINSGAWARDGLISEAANEFGSQCVVASIDFRRSENGSAECYSHCGAQSTGRDAISRARQLQDLGAGEILLTSVTRDGTMTGYDIDAIRAVSDAVNIPVIASGGCGSYEDMQAALETGGASAVAAASIFHFTHLTPLGAKNFLSSRGVATRKSQAWTQLW